MGSKEYNKTWMQKQREKKRKANLIKEGRCPECEVILELSPNHDCKNYDWKILDE